ncbi:hypothetical protein DSM3645_25307 [Blastopirellula marina DSM 3645]|uniref:Uncharacterized protein n=1 Tax=Blastopirellula marina DSM 3645 TaxID=314230 RepID=A4A0C9_9BACT|nr:hypothetical protein DSM3645_25307 [Blastopirellula marina DSM 3645]
MIADKMPMAVWAGNFKAFHKRFRDSQRLRGQDCGWGGELTIQDPFGLTSADGGEIRIIPAEQIGNNLGDAISRFSNRTSDD